jgi:predicted DsbA family dithiol-disulfide isomerase
MTQTLKIDFVSDVVCPWCVVGLGGLEAALETLKAEGITAEITVRPFELNPQMAPEGENVGEHVARKYGSTPEQSAGARQMIHDRAAEVGFTMNTGPDSRIWNTFDSHRLLHLAAPGSRPGVTAARAMADQKALKRELFDAHFTRGLNLTDPEVLADAAAAAGLDRDEAVAVLAEGRYAEAVRTEEALWVSRGINSVPAVVVEGKYLISGGQPVEVFEQALRKIAGEVAAAAG